MFILIYKTFTFDFYHASEIAFFGNTAQRKRTLADLHVSCGRDYRDPTKGGTQNDGVARKTKGGTQHEGWHTTRRGGTQNEGVGN